MDERLVEMFETIARERRWNDHAGETLSGPGSVLQSTVELRRWLPQFFHLFGVHSLLDIPCGEWGWMSQVPLGGIDYLGADISPTIISSNRAKFPQFSFELMDLTTDRLPSADVVLVKDCFQHLANRHIEIALRNLEDSGSSYLITSSDIHPWPRSNAYRPEHRAGDTNFWFPENVCLLSGLNHGKWVGNVRLDRKIFTLWRMGAPATSRDRLLLRESIEGLTSDATWALLDSFADGRAWPTYANYGEGPTGTYLLPSLQGVLADAEPFVVTTAAAGILASIDATATVLEHASRLAAEGRYERDEVLYLLWVADELCLLGSSSGCRPDCWEQQQMAVAISKRYSDSELGIAGLCSKLIEPPSWLRRLWWQMRPAEGLLNFIQWTQSQGIATWLEEGEAGPILSIPVPREWMNEVKRLRP
jgi:hypothetical protein